MTLNPDDLQVASFATSREASAFTPSAETDSQYPPTHPTEQTYCFICPPEPWTASTCP